MAFERSKPIQGRTKTTQTPERRATAAVDIYYSDVPGKGFPADDANVGRPRETGLFGGGVDCVLR